jgi:hypothetical protein
MDALDRAMQGKQGQRTDLVDNLNEVDRPTGTSEAATVRQFSFRERTVRIGCGGLMGLRDTLENAGGSLTVPAPQNDPFRVDTPAGHRDGKWLADKLVELKLSGPRHLRGLHYALIGQPKPNGLPYTNTAEDWQWLATPAKCARWLGYIPFDRIVDQRNDEPQVTSFTRYSFPPYPYINTPSFEVKLPDADQLQPRVWLGMFHAQQPYRIVLVGEKSSLRPILSRVAARYAADLYLPTGEISDTQVYLMASNAAEDGRQMACFYFSDSEVYPNRTPLCDSRWDFTVQCEELIASKQYRQAVAR